LRIAEKSAPDRARARPDSVAAISASLASTFLLGAAECSRAPSGMLGAASRALHRPNPSGGGPYFIGRAYEGLRCSDDSGRRAVGFGHIGTDEKRHALMLVKANGECAPLIDYAEPSIGEHVYYRGARGKDVRRPPGQILDGWRSSRWLPERVRCQADEPSRAEPYWTRLVLSTCVPVAMP
jgi:hypothetical protein